MITDCDVVLHKQCTGALTDSCYPAQTQKVKQQTKSPKPRGAQPAAMSRESSGEYSGSPPRSHGGVSEKGRTPMPSPRFILNIRNTSFSFPRIWRRDRQDDRLTRAHRLSRSSGGAVDIERLRHRRRSQLDRRQTGRPLPEHADEGGRLIRSHPLSSYSLLLNRLRYFELLLIFPLHLANWLQEDELRESKRVRSVRDDDNAADVGGQRRAKR